MTGLDPLPGRWFACEPPDFGFHSPAGPSSVPDPFARPPLPRLAGLDAAAEWAATARFGDEDRRAALVWLTDVLAIGAAPPVATLGVPRALPDWGSGPPARLWRPVGGASTAPLTGAILWNRMVGDALELHAGPECVAAAVAAAEALDRPLAELLDALTVGCGVGAFVRDRYGPLMEPAGVHAPGATAPLPAAAAVGRLARLAPDAMAAALRRADAALPAHPYRAFAEGNPVKLLYGAWGQALGAAAVLDPAFPEPPAAPRSPGERFEAAVPRVQPKKHPGSRAIQPALEALEALGADDGGSIIVETYPFSTTVSGWAEPVRAPIAAQMHIPSAVALFLKRQPLEAADFAEFEAVREAAGRVRVVSRNFGPPGVRVRRARVTIAGRTAEADSPWPDEVAIRERFQRFTADLTLPDPASVALSAPAGRLFGR